MGWVVAVALLAWSSLGGPEVAGRWALLVVGGAVLATLDARIQRAQRVVVEMTSLQLRMYAAAVPAPRPPLMTRVK